ncbi:M15 family metallopeptidase [Brevibacillus borstelensis]|uniref:M15 family metallopeptidase n=1 Tax=Brevibacillus borstelensis TaxID=45462 RepID=UPI0015628E7C|nr:M15 family metallopeptidase [Brevibacillus borstelensis]MBE5397647.1 M15 family metallopeptidase [Brevibacillus borstelensis]MED2011009.1 M15 family metallopeptidase [Brevibacillus borstelensis]
MKQDLPIPPERPHLYVQPLLEECGEAMLPLSSLSEKITVWPMYYKQGYDGTTPEAYLRKSAALRLVQAAERLPDGYRFVVFDGWRSYQVQSSLYERFKQTLLKQGWEEGEALQAELSKFVAVPSKDVQKPSPHLSGGAVDLAIEGPDGWLDMGTEFDDFSERASTRFYENALSPDEQAKTIRANRRLLYHLMTEAGFVNYPKEWWHYEYGTLSWARQTTGQAMYGGILEIDSENS